MENKLSGSNPAIKRTPSARLMSLIGVVTDSARKTERKELGFKLSFHQDNSADDKYYNTRNRPAYVYNEMTGTGRWEDWKRNYCNWNCRMPTRNDFSRLRRLIPEILRGQS
jgi:hypothetical protein